MEIGQSSGPSIKLLSKAEKENLALGDHFLNFSNLRDVTMAHNRHRGICWDKLYFVSMVFPICFWFCEIL